MASSTLVLSSHGAEVKRLESARDRVVLGRASASSPDRVPLPSNGFLDSAIVSRSHAAIEWTWSGAERICTIVDLGSTHGTSIIRTGTTLPVRPYPSERLYEGDVIVLGKTVDDVLRRIDAVTLRVAYEHRPAAIVPHVSSFGIDEEDMMMMAEEMDVPELDELASSDVEDGDGAALKTSPIVSNAAVSYDYDDYLYGSLEEDALPVADVKIQSTTTTVISAKPTLAEDVTFSLADVGPRVDSFESALEEAQATAAQPTRSASSVEPSQDDAGASQVITPADEPSQPPSSQPMIPARSVDSTAPSSVLGKRARSDDEAIIEAPVAKVARVTAGPSAVKLTTVAVISALGGAMATLVGLASLGSYLD